MKMLDIKRNCCSSATVDTCNSDVYNKQWIDTLIIGGKLDAFHATKHWKIATIKTISNDKFNKYIKIRYDGILETESIFINNEIISKTILPLNTKTSFHQYLKPYNKNIKICQYLKPSLSTYDDSDDSDIGNIKHCCFCNKSMCLCALIDCPLQQEGFVCRDCICCYQEKQMIDCIQNAKVNLDMDLIKLISEFAVGFTTECCNQLHSCKNKIYFDNIFDFLKKDQVFDTYGSVIYYYRSSKCNQLKTIKNIIPTHHKLDLLKFNTARIFCSFCTSKLKSCELYCRVLDVEFRFVERREEGISGYICHEHPKCCKCGAVHVNISFCSVCDQWFCIECYYQTTDLCLHST
eukprot:97485_1